MAEEPHLYRKAPKPAVGPTFDNSWVEPYQMFAGAPALMFDTSKLTLLDFAEMRNHPQVNASLSMMTFMLHQCDWYIYCEDKKIAEVVEDNMRLIWTQLIRGMSTAYWAGRSPMVLEWENVENGRYTYVSKIKDLHPGTARPNFKEVDSSYVPRPEDRAASGDNTARPKVKVFDGIKKDGLNYPIPPMHSLFYPLMMEHGNYTGRKLLAPAFAPWYFSLLVHLFSNRYFERFGEPTPIGRAPFNEEFQFKDANGVDTEMTGKQVVENAIGRLRSSGSVVLPSDRDPTASVRSEYMYDIEFLESQMRGADFERYLSRLDEEISLSIFTPMLLMRSGDRGSLNLGVQHAKTWANALNAMASDIKEYIDPYLVERIKAINFSPNAPRCEWRMRPMGKDNDETIRAMVTTLLREGAAKVDLEQLGMALGMTLSEVRGVRPTGSGNDPAATDPRGDVGRDDRTVGSPASTTNPTSSSGVSI